MKLRLTALLLAGLLLLTGCTPVDNSSDQPQQQNPQQTDPTAWDGDIGTTVENLLNGGKFAMRDDFVYIDVNQYIVEYDMLTGTSVEIPMPDGGGDLTVRMSNGSSHGNLFLLEDGPMFTMSTTKRILERDSLGQYVSEQRTRLIQLARLSLDGKDPVIFPELGDHIYTLVPIRKENAEETAKSGSDNLFAGFDLYCHCWYDTFPEAAAQLALDGITLEEPWDEVERSKYRVTALFHIDGDTMEKTLLAKDIQGFYINQTHIYYSTNTLEGVLEGVPDSRFVSDRKEINFQPLDPSHPGYNFYEDSDGLYLRVDDQIYRCQDDVRTPVVTIPSQATFWGVWRDQVICVVPEYNYFNYYDQPWDKMWSYDMETGEGRLLSDHIEKNRAIQILQNRYLACQEYYWEYDAYVLLDLETGERIEMHRVERTEEQVAKEKASFEKFYNRRKEEYEQRSTGEAGSP